MFMNIVDYDDGMALSRTAMSSPSCPWMAASGLLKPKMLRRTSPGEIKSSPLLKTPISKLTKEGGR